MRRARGSSPDAPPAPCHSACLPGAPPVRIEARVDRGRRGEPGSRAASWRSHRSGERPRPDVERKVEHERHVSRGRSSKQQPAARPGETHPYRWRRRWQQQRLNHQLQDDAAPAGAERQPHGDVSQSGQRRMARASRRFATLAQAAARTRPTAAHDDAQGTRVLTAQVVLAVAARIRRERRQRRYRPIRIGFPAATGQPSLLRRQLEHRLERGANLIGCRLRPSSSHDAHPPVPGCTREARSGWNRRCSAIGTVMSGDSPACIVPSKPCAATPTITVDTRLT